METVNATTPIDQVRQGLAAAENAIVVRFGWNAIKRPYEDGMTPQSILDDIGEAMNIPPIRIVVQVGGRSAGMDQPVKPGQWVHFIPRSVKLFRRHRNHEIRSDRRRGMRIAVLARLYGLSPRHIRRLTRSRLTRR